MTPDFGVPEVRLGFVPQTLLPYFVRGLGIRNMRRYGISGESFGAHQALRVGLIYELATADNFDED